MIRDFNEISIEYGWNHISKADEKLLAAVVDITGPFHLLTDKIQAENSPTLSLILPGINHLIAHLKKGVGLAEVRQALVERLELRFRDVLSNEDPLYLAASMLDPRTAYLLKNRKEAGERAMIAVADTILANELSSPLGNASSPLAVGENIFGFGSLEVAAATPVRNDPLVDQVRKHLETVTETHSTEAPFDYWHRMSQVLGGLR